MKVIRLSLQIIGFVALLLLAVLALSILLWSFVCFLGGPDGRIGSLESFAFGFVYLLVGSGMLWLSVFGFRKIRSFGKKRR